MRLGEEGGDKRRFLASLGIVNVRSFADRRKKARWDGAATKAKKEKETEGWIPSLTGSPIRACPRLDRGSGTGVEDDREGEGGGFSGRGCQVKLRRCPALSGTSAALSVTCRAAGESGEAALFPRW